MDRPLDGWKLNGLLGHPPRVRLELSLSPDVVAWLTATAATRRISEIEVIRLALSTLRTEEEVRSGVVTAGFHTEPSWFDVVEMGRS